MLHKDFLLKQLHQLLDELKQRISSIAKSEIENIEIAFDDLYKDYFQLNRDSLVNASMEEIVEMNLSEDQLTLLVELMLQDAKYNQFFEKHLLKQSIDILKHIDVSSNVYSIERTRNIELVESKLKMRNHFQ